MKNVLAGLLVVAAMTVGSAVLACGGGAPVTMTVTTSAGFDPIPPATGAPETNESTARIEIG
jgi:hypothetical protein